MTRGRIFLLIVVVVIGLLVAAAINILHDGLSARAKPSALETAIARTARKMASPASARSAKNPVADSSEIQREARLHFADHCAFCHGNDGSGDTMMGHGLYPKPPDLRAAETQNLSDGEIFFIIENGVRLTGMPSFGGAENHSNAHGGEPAEHGDVDSWKLVHFIRHLPHLTTEERLEMEKYNPKGPEDREEEQEEQEFLNGAPAKPQRRDERHPH
jgi:mono/diheme cytochrome c family protein